MHTLGTVPHLLISDQTYLFNACLVLGSLSSTNLFWRDVSSGIRFVFRVSHTETLSTKNYVKRFELNFSRNFILSK